MKKEILLIEDDPQEFMKLKFFLEEQQYSVIPNKIDDMINAMSREDGDSIEDFVKQQVKNNYSNIKLIICDIKLINDLNGGPKIVHSIRDFKKINPPFWTLMVPIISITSNAHLQDRILIAGANLSIVRERVYKEPDLIKTLIDTQIMRFEKLLEATTENCDKSNNKVFIVHGHDTGKKETVARFLESQDIKAIILHEQDDEGETIMTKLEKNADVDFAIILYTQDDKGNDKNKEGFNYRARQNVVFEHGYMYGKLGRNKVCVLVEEDIEQPGDTAGVIYIKMDNDGAWKLKLAKRMFKQGIKVNYANIKI